MNRQLFTYSLTFLVGVGVGFFVTRKLLEEHYAQLADEEIESVKESLGWNYAKADVEATQKILGGMDQNAPSKSSLEGTYTNEYNRVKCNYGLMHQPESEATEETDDNKDHNPEEGFEVNFKNPYVISAEDFGDRLHYDKVTLYFYSEDGVVADEDESPLSAVDDLLGSEAISQFDSDCTVYVRNESLATDFEVCLIAGSFAELITGMTPENPPRAKKPHQEEED